MDFYPTRCARDVLPVVFGSPTFHETHSDRAHFRQFVHRLETVIDALRKQLSEFGVVEDSQATTGGYFTHGRRMETVMMVAIPRLYEYGRIREAFSVDFAVYVIKVDTFAYVSPSVFYCRISVDVA